MYPRFPSEKSKYLRSVGRVLPRILGKILLELGFGVWVNPQPRNGVDIEVYDKEGTLVLVVEILNWYEL
jgi:hypothetical protein